LDGLATIALTTEALASTQPDLLLASSGLSFMKKGTTTSPFLPAGAQWMWDMVASTPVHLMS
jgi:hypothetical protein